MKKNIWQRNLMLACVVVLGLFMVSILGRMCVRQFMVKRLGMDNIITQTVLFDRPDMQNNRGATPMQVKIEPIDWQKRYPFRDAEAADERQDKNAKADQPHPLSTLKGKVMGKVNNAEKKIKEWSTTNLAGYNYLVTGAYFYNKYIGWGVTTGATMQIYTFPDGHMTDIHGRGSVADKAESVYRLSQYAQARGIGFLYVQAPTVVNKYADSELAGIDFKNEHGDALMEQLQEYQVNTMDLREELHKEFSDAEYHDLFFRTDHHWKPKTGLWAASKIASRLHADYGIEVDMSHFSRDMYREVVYPAYFLGSYGRQVTLVNTDAEDFCLYYPMFPTSVRWQIPTRGMDVTGDFSVMYDMKCVEYQEYGSLGINTTAYQGYSYGDNPLLYADNLLLSDLPEQKVMLIKDSFSNTTLPFLLMGIKHVVEVDLRSFDGSLETLIDEEQPDVICVMYYSRWLGYPIDWNSHKDKFDFR